MLNELSLIDKEFKKFDNLEKISDSKILLKKINLYLENIKEALRNITWQEIDFELDEETENKKIYNINWNSSIDSQLFKLKKISRNLKDEEVSIKSKIETQQLIINYLQIDIELGNFNSIHFPIDMPDYYKNIGLGIKIFRKAVEEFGYISSVIAGPIQASFEAKFVFDHFLHNDDVYSVTKNNSGVLLISKSLNIQNIKELLEKYLQNISKENYAIDKFLKRNNLLKHLL